ncbi:MAG: NAD(P)-dependent oxidoreductase [Synergistaceae bacterium]|nr:NAD(P)-dependent oxidoreductase [Synergistaceae bacterium]
MTRIGFIGIGVMGQSMAGHLMDAGHELRVYNRTALKCESLVARGAKLMSGAGETAAESDAVFTIIGFPKDVEEAYLGPGGIVESAKPGTLLVDMTTSSPALARRIYGAAKARGLGSCDAPVTGGDRGAREATLSIMAGGDEEDFERALPMLRLMGKNIARFGGAGCGQLAKLANQIVIAGTMMGVCEGLSFAKGAGLDPGKFLECVEGGSAGSWSLSNYGPRILKGDFEPGFFVKHFIKDMKLAAESSEEIGMELDGLSAALAQYEKLAASGGEENGTQGLFKLYDSMLKN